MGNLRRTPPRCHRDARHGEKVPSRGALPDALSCRDPLVTMSACCGYLFWGPPGRFTVDGGSSCGILAVVTGVESGADAAAEVHRM
jgi:hypothetical protein